MDIKAKKYSLKLPTMNMVDCASRRYWGGGGAGCKGQEHLRLKLGFMHVSMDGPYSKSQGNRYTNSYESVRTSVRAIQYDYWQVHFGGFSLCVDVSLDFQGRFVWLE